MRIEFTRIILLSACLLVIASGSVYANGTITGTVTDASDGSELFGATILVAGTSIGTATDIEGRYQLRHVPPGSIQLRISYIGYDTQFITIDVVSGRTSVLDIELTPSALVGEEVRVTAQALGQLAAINQQRASNTIINVVSEEKIKELPDANAAEAIGRLPGVSLLRSGGEANKVILRGLSDRYLNVTIDGVRVPTTDPLARGLDLSAISQSSLSGIELFKAVTPDKDGDAIAGSINLVTRRASPGRELRVNSMGGYNQLMDDFNQYDFNFRYNERFFNNRIGLQVNGTLESKIRSNEQINISYSDRGADLSQYFVSDVSLRFVDEQRSRHGVGAIFDVNTRGDGNIKLSTLYSSTTRDFISHSRNYPFTTASVTYEFRDREQQIDLFSAALIGENHLAGFDIDWTASWSQSKAQFPFDYQLTFVEPSSPTSGMMNAPEVSDTPEVLTRFAFNNFNAASLSEAYDYTQENSETDLSGKLDVNRSFALNSFLSGSFKFGGKYTSRNRTNVNTRNYAPYYLGYWRAFEQLPDGTVVPKNFAGSYFEDFFAGFLQNPANNLPSFSNFLNISPYSKIILNDFDLNPLISRNRLRQWYELNRFGINQAGNNTEYHNDPSAESNTYDITESIAAGYAMKTLNLGPFLTTIMGVRVEHEFHEYNNQYSPRQIGGFPIPVGSTRDTSSTYSETIFLPHVHVNLKPSESVNVRMAAYRALARPDFNMRLLSFFAWRDASTGGDRILILGNPDLRTAKAWNYEINTSVYDNRAGLFSVSVFYKEIQDMYHMLDGINTVGDTLINALGLDWSSPHRGNYQLFVPYNSPEPSRVWGVEVDHQINFHWLPGVLQNLVLSYNATLVRSETTLRGGVTDTTYVPDPIFGQRPVFSIKAITKKEKLSSQPDFFGNLSLGYDRGRFSGRISVFHQGEFYSAFSPTGRGDSIVGAYTKTDVSVTYKIRPNVTMVVNVNNLTNITEENLRHNQINNYKIPRTRERYGRTFDVGLRMVF
jgi:TonB-dependent receptor